MFAVQDRSGTGREEDREAARKADEADGVQGVPQWSHGDRLKDSGWTVGHWCCACSSHTHLENMSLKVLYLEG